MVVSTSWSWEALVIVSTHKMSFKQPSTWHLVPNMVNTQRCGLFVAQCPLFPDEGLGQMANVTWIFSGQMVPEEVRGKVGPRSWVPWPPTEENISSKTDNPFSYLGENIGNCCFSGLTWLLVGWFTWYGRLSADYLGSGGVIHPVSADVSDSWLGTQPYIYL